METCKSQIDILREEVEQYIWTFRWLWLVNLGAIVWGIAVRHYDVVAVAAVSALIAIVGVGTTRRGRRLVDRAEVVCAQPPRQESAEP
ncbi:MAG: hypothetical protein HYX78_10975 [Armatimonadetes bacterium]|nr:hypothetical protein [Armatimonadota bacterium]